MLRSILGYAEESAQDISPQEQQTQGVQQQLQEVQQGADAEEIPRAVWGSEAVDESAPQAAQKRDRRGGAPRSRKARKAIINDDAEIGDDDPPETIGDALSLCKKLVGDQIKRASDEKPDVNTPVTGDAKARKTILTILPDSLVREVFMYTIKFPEALPRIRTLFGAPPFNFLRTEDAELVRATGIASNRVNMTYSGSSSSEIASYSQFGEAHFVDGFQRDYRAVAVGYPKETDPLVCDIAAFPTNKNVYLNVRVPKRSRDEKIALLKDARTKKSLLFPHVGEMLTMSYSPGYARFTQTQQTIHL